MSSPTFPYFCLLLALALLLGYTSCENKLLGKCGGVFLPPPHSKDCNVTTCLVYVSKNASKCPPGFLCYSSLNDASEKVLNNQRIELLDEITVLDGLVLLCDLWNVTIVSVKGTQILMSPESPDINGPYLVLQQCQDFRLVGLTLNRVVVGGSIISTVSSSAVFDNFVCNSSTMTHKLAVATKFPGPCIGGRSSQLSIVRSQFTNCQTFAGTAGTVAVGGAIALDGGRLYVYDSYFGKNSLTAGAAYGGAIYVRDGYLSLYNTSFIDNRVTGVTGHGGAVYLFGGDLEVTLCEFSRNLISVVVPSEALGGAIYQLSQPVMPTTNSYFASIMSSNFTNNTIVGSGNFEGGALSLGARSVILQNNLFYRNKIHSPRTLTQVSTGSTFSVKGGAVRLMAHDAVILNNRFIQNNVSAPRGYTPGWSYGGAIDIATDTFSRTFHESVIVVKDNVFQYNHAIGGSSTEDNSGGGAFGGAIRIVALDAKITLEQNKFLRNTATGGDGPISGGIAQGAAIVINHLSYLNYSMLEAKFDHEYTVKHQRFESHRSIYFPLFEGDSSTHITHNDRPRVSNISNPFVAGDALGDTFFKEGQRTSLFKKPAEVSEVYISSCSFHQNGLRGGTGAMMGGDAAGGALYFEGSMLDLKECQFHINGAQGGDTSNSAIGANSGGFGKGGAIFLHQSTTSVSIADSIFKTNFAYGGRGWSDRIYPIPFKFGRSGISFGGAIAAWSYFGDTNVNPVNIYRSVFSTNRANCQALPASCGPGIGGAIWGRLLFVYDSLFMRNDAAHGGAIYALSLTCEQCLFHNNQVIYESETSGGAIYAYNATITNSHFESNSATSSKLGGSAVGGAIHTDESLHLKNSTFFMNHVLAQTIGSLSQGGAVAASKRLTIQNCKFNHNGALTETGDGMVGQGGSLYLDISEGPSELIHSTISNSLASYGGGIYIRGAAAVNLVWKGVKVRFNNATRAGGGIAYLPDNYAGDIVSSYFCSTCEVASNLAEYYGNDVISPYAAIAGSTSAVTKPGLPFSARFNILDYSLNIVKEYDLRLTLIPNTTRPFQSGVWQNEELMDFKTGYISFPSMTAWGVPGEVFALNFSLTALNMGDFGAPDEISLTVPYQLSSCPPGHKLDTSSTYTSCQQCSVGEYGFRSNCTACPDDYVCASTPFNPVKPTPLIYQIEAGFVPSPRINPTSIIECPYSTADRVDGALQSSCLPSTCATDCGPNRGLSSSFSHVLTNGPSSTQDPTLLPTCNVLCDENNCATGYTGFLCSQCVCKGQGECWYPADETCHLCKSTWRPTVVIFSVAAAFFILLKGTLLVLVMGVLSIVVIFLLTFDLVSTLIPSIFGTAFIIFAEAQRGSSSGLIKSFVFYIQTISVFITPEVMPRQLSKITSVRVLTQFRVFGLECLSKEMFGDPFQRFLFSMVLPLALLFIVSVLYWLCEFLRGVSIFRALQDFDPIDHIPFFRSRLSRARGYQPGGEFSLLKDELQSESEVSLVGEAYLSDSGTNDMSAWIAAETDYLESQETLSWKDHVQFMNRKIGRVALFLAFASHFELCNRVLEVFAPCIHVPSENFSYSSTYPWLICSNRAAGISFFSPHTVHGRMAISGLIFGFFYILGIPVVFISLLYWKRTEIKAGDSSTGRWLGLLYNSYRPSLHYFELAWLFRRILFAASISIIPYPLVSHFLAPCCVLFISLLIQRRYKPFISKSDNNMEMISLLSNLFAIIANAVITSRPTALDATVWRWLNFFIFSITLLAFLYKLFKPFLLFLRPVSKED